MANNFERQVTTLANFGVDALLVADVETPIEVAEHKLGCVIPKGKVVTAVALRNAKNNLVGAGAMVQVKLGDEMLGERTDIATIKGTTVYAPVEGGHVLTADTPIAVVVAGGTITAGDLDVIVLYF